MGASTDAGRGGEDGGGISAGGELEGGVAGGNIKKKGVEVAGGEGE